jgi:hypothetical protein
VRNGYFSSRRLIYAIADGARLPLNPIAQSVFKILTDDRITGEWLFANRDGERIVAIEKGLSPPIYPKNYLPGVPDFSRKSRVNT